MFGIRRVRLFPRSKTFGIWPLKFRVFWRK